MIGLNELNEILAPSLISCANSSTENTLIIGEPACYLTLSTKGALSVKTKAREFRKTNGETGAASPPASREVKQHDSDKYATKTQH